MSPQNHSSTPKVKPLTSVLVKPAGADCNLACDYCFYYEKGMLNYPETPRQRMSDEVLESLVRQVMRDGGAAVGFGWQGGEPTLMGVDFFRKVVEFQQRYGEPGQSVGNGLQTNGLLIDESWVELLRENQFLVGLSLDGPQFVHDHYRHSRGGEPTWERVIKTARLLLRERVAVNAMAVVNDLSVNHPVEIYDLFRSLGLRYMQFIPCIEADPDSPSPAAPFTVSATAYGEFLCRLFDRWMRDFKNGRTMTSVRWFDSLFHLYVGREAPECTLAEACGAYVVVEHNGDVYACDFYVEPQWKLGNLLQTDLLELLNSPRQHGFGQRKQETAAECAACPWLRYCHGGCPRDRQHTPSVNGSNRLCGAYKMFFEHADTRLRQLAARWLEEDAAAQARARRKRP